LSESKESGDAASDLHGGDEYGTADESDSGVDDLEEGGGLDNDEGFGEARGIVDGCEG